mgnify:CR=1 FL=1
MVKNVDKADTYDFIIDHFGKERIESRFAWIYDLMQDYIDIERLQDKVYISEDILYHVMIDYFVDIYRLKEFQGIEKTHDSKIYAYLISWILRHKPLQVKSENAPECAFVNEHFCSELLKGYLFKKPKNVPIVNSKKENMDTFSETLLYYFKYRDYSAKSIEMIILAFEAGRSYQFSADKAD